MFCPKCGIKMPDRAKFCPNCGNAVRTVISPARKGNDKRHIKAAAMGVASVAVLCFIVIVSRSVNTGSSKRSTLTSSVMQSVDDEQNDMTTLTASHDTYLEGEYPELLSITLTDNSTLTLVVGASCPKLTSISCKSIVTEGMANDSPCFDIEAFPLLRTVTISASNSAVDDSVLWTYETCYNLQRKNKLDSLILEISHSESDLYGTWSDSNGKLAFTLGADGSVRVTTGSGILGADLLEYTVVDDDTLRLEASSDVADTFGDGIFGFVGKGVANVVSVDMDYVLFGNVMFVELNGTQYTLTRN